MPGWMPGLCGCRAQNPSSFLRTLHHQPPGSVAELLFDSRADASSDDVSPADKARATVYLSHLKGYKRMGTAWVECVEGCECERSVLDGTWAQQATLMQIHSFKVGGAECLVGRQHEASSRWGALCWSAALGVRQPEPPAMWAALVGMQPRGRQRQQASVSLQQASLCCPYTAHVPAAFSSFPDLHPPTNSEPVATAQHALALLHAYAALAKPQCHADAPPLHPLHALLLPAALPCRWISITVAAATHHQCGITALHLHLHHRHIHTLQWHACATLACLLTVHSLASPAGCLCLPVLQVTQHAQCRVRVTVRKEPGEVPQQGHKVGGVPRVGRRLGRWSAPCRRRCMHGLAGWASRVPIRPNAPKCSAADASQLCTCWPCLWGAACLARSRAAAASATAIASLPRRSLSWRLWCRTTRCAWTKTCGRPLRWPAKSWMHRGQSLLAFERRQEVGTL